MDTDQLIRTLAADNAHHARPVGMVLALSLLSAAPVSVALFLAILGVRPDVMTAMHNPFFDLKFVVTLALALSALSVGLHLSRPEAGPRGWIWLLLIPLGIVAAGIGSEMMLPQRLPMMTRLVGHNSRVCLSAIPLISLPLLVAALIGLRHGAPTRPVLTGALAGFLSAGLAATLYAAHCTDDSPLFVATWYTLAALAVAAVGALAGSRVLRF
jgi:hypothetical protein